LKVLWAESDDTPTEAYGAFAEKTDLAHQNEKEGHRGIKPEFPQSSLVKREIFETLGKTP